MGSYAGLTSNRNVIRTSWKVVRVSSDSDSVSSANELRNFAIIRVPNTYVLSLVWKVYLVSNAFLSHCNVHSFTRGRSV
jgi:hypothetical protein